MIHIDTIQENDNASWEKQYTGYLEFYGKSSNEADISTLWNWILTERVHAIVARDDNNQIIGFTHLQEILSPIRGRKIGVLDDLFVDPSARGLGVARELLGAVEEFRNKSGWSMVRWITAPDNKRAINLYDHVASATPWITYELKECN